MTSKVELHFGILSGGAGTRLWPLSREFSPKQFFDLVGSGQPLIIDAVSRLESFGQTTLITTQNLEKASFGVLKEFNKDTNILAEPFAKNTAAAIAYFTFYVFNKNPKAIVGVFPADHAIKMKEVFQEQIRKATALVDQADVVTLGIWPDHPSTAYGYKELKKKVDGDSFGKAHEVLRFVEKPSQEKAEEFLHSGRFVWNAGMFVFRAENMVGLFKKHLPEFYKAFVVFPKTKEQLKEVYGALPSISFDHALMEKLENILCLPTDMGWSDIGSWEEIAKGRGLAKDVLQSNAKNNFYLSHLVYPKKVAFVGVQNLIAIDTQDALLLLNKGNGQEVKTIVESLKKENSDLTKIHPFEERPWGRFEVLMDTENLKSKRISVWPGQKLSYQSHSKRAENWVVVKGEAEVTLNDEVLRLKVGDHVFIPQGAKHRMANSGKETLEFIEVQTGSYFGEDDIVRYEDIYGRI